MDYYYEYENLDNSEDIEEHDISSEEYYEYSGYLTAESFKDIYYTCAVPSTIQIGRYIIVVLSCSLMYHLLRSLLENAWPSKESLHHLSSMVCGFVTLYLSLSYDWLIVLLLCLLAYTLILIISYYKSPHEGMGVAIFTIVIQLACEYFMKHLEWQKVRGVQMVATMKTISFAFDFGAKDTGERSTVKLPDLLSYLGYVFCPTTCMLGPWMPYSLYNQKQRTSLKNLHWLLWTFTNVTLAVVFLNLSNCFIPWLRSDDLLWLRIYLDALAVRCSHYFISFLSQATVVVGGVPSQKPDYVLGYKITQPLNIEFPRSLHSLVRCWNIPMHQWLKKYMFRKLQITYGSYFVSLLFTYVISALLHGFHAKVHLVLLSLAGFTYIENSLRSTLAHVYDSCLEVNDCNRSCTYTHCPRRRKWSSDTLLVRFINFMFSNLAILNLAYLGVMMSDNSMSDESHQYEDLWKWQRLNYIGHFINLIMYIFYLSI
uniref:Protein-serine O-palmitoleoyltransferase porcupine n=1 Tax=Glossina austeni TaxID=7395 RepID=A0A1A9UHR3_GLOAU